MGSGSARWGEGGKSPKELTTPTCSQRRIQFLLQSKFARFLSFLKTTVFTTNNVSFSPPSNVRARRQTDRHTPPLSVLQPSPTPASLRVGLISRHRVTGDPMPADMVRRLRRGKELFGATDLQQQIVFALTDLEVHALGGGGGGGGADSSMSTLSSLSTTSEAGRFCLRVTRFIRSRRKVYS